MRLPLFPLHTVLYPGGSCPLRVFEARYRAMMEDLLAGTRRFGIVAIRRGLEVGGDAETFSVGCVASADPIRRHDDGTFDVLARGVARFRIVERLPDDPYPQAEVEPCDEAIGLDADRALRRAREGLERYLRVLERVRGITGRTPPGYADDDPIAASWAIAEALHVDLPHRQGLLEIDGAAARLEAAAKIARTEAILLDAIGPSVGRPSVAPSPN